MTISQQYALAIVGGLGAGALLAIVGQLISQRVWRNRRWFR
ncbi:MAG TPA: hypothetical protein VHX38_02345 [Pseudonocardiaceae bacterium]|nr:hypothetical protein [Pseudonocardiaceae bacterium]